MPSLQQGSTNAYALQSPPYQEEEIETEDLEQAMPSSDYSSAMHVISDVQERRIIETRRIRMEKDREYEQSLPADQEKERALQQEEMKNIRLQHVPQASLRALVRPSRA